MTTPIEGTPVPERLERLAPGAGLQLTLSPELTARVRAAAVKRGGGARRLVLDVVDAVFAPGAQSLVDAVLDRDPD